MDAALQPVADIGPLSTAEAARWIGMHPNSVKRIPASELPFYRVGSRGDRRYRLADVVAYIERRAEK